MLSSASSWVADMLLWSYESVDLVNDYAHHGLLPPTICATVVFVSFPTVGS